MTHIGTCSDVVGLSQQRPHFVRLCLPVSSHSFHQLPDPRPQCLHAMRNWQPDDAGQAASFFHELPNLSAHTPRTSNSVSVDPQDLKNSTMLRRLFRRAPSYRLAKSLSQTYKV
ncbi:hypothetical protein JAAARDRAFT_296076 [Jaapia argillacea MUCL 33604]|uniref:Uncharacterized protein n=1 Tax=Jaapia argillacea MUCL 33604 TaxID=933084 RepID=A0A067Q1X0_9AGAM|nr:hypothetical protein JAAARDRAFT_296076 [Jaapia argillacea MUCL 33604]